MSLPNSDMYTEVLAVGAERTLHRARVEVKQPVTDRRKAQRVRVVAPGRKCNGPPGQLAGAFLSAAFKLS